MRVTMFVCGAVAGFGCTLIVATVATQERGPLTGALLLAGVVVAVAAFVAAGFCPNER